MSVVGRSSLASMFFLVGMFVGGAHAAELAGRAPFAGSAFGQQSDANAIPAYVQALLEKTADGFAAQGFGAYLSAMGVIFVGSLMKNFFEEFAWRSYLTSRLEAAGVKPMLNHIITGILWMTWHLPYYYYYLDRAALESALTTSIPVFIALGYLVMIPTAILFGELRLLSKSTWTVFLLHQIINAVSMPLLMNGFIEVNGSLAPVFTPTNEGVIVSLLFGLVGWALMKVRLKKAG